MAFDNKFIEQLKEKNDIVEVIGGYCSLEQKGGSYWACCPLPGHMEKTPSFTVNPVGQFYHCFGCGRGGDVIKFIQEIESLEFMDAVKYLADRAGLEVPVSTARDEAKNAEEKKRKERCLGLLKETAHFYVNNLALEEAREYREYLEKRGIDKKIQRTFGIGASLDYTSLPKFLQSKGYTFDEMLSAGVVSYNKERNEYSDFLGKRLIIPIIDSLSSVIAFGGRVLGKTDFAKYKNTAETFLFSKKNCLYNINSLKKAKRQNGKLDFVIMVEGYMDTIALYTAGFTNVVASMGTSLTQAQAKLISRYTDTVVISYDGDSAGQKATLRGLEILKEVGLTVKIIALPDNLDPDELIRERGVDAYLKLIDDSLLLADYKLQVLKNRYDITTTQGRRAFVDEAIKVIREVEKSFEQEELLKQLSSMSGIAYEYLRRDLENLPKPNQSAKSVTTPKVEVASGIVTAERYVLWSILLGKPFANYTDIEDVEFSTDLRTKIADFIFERLDQGLPLQTAMLFDYLGENSTEELNEILSRGEELTSSSNAKKYYRDCLYKLVAGKLKQEIKYLEEMFVNEMDNQKRRQITELLQLKLKKLTSLKTEDKR